MSEATSLVDQQNAGLGAPGPFTVGISRAPDDPAWDSFVAATPGGDPAQTTLWAQIRAVFGWRPLRIIARREGRIVAGCQLLLRPLPLGAIAYISKGPLFADDDSRLVGLVLDHLKRVARAKWIHYLVVQPPENGGVVASQLPAWGFRSTPLDIRPRATIVMDLSPDLDTLLGRMRRRTQRYIRKGLREGVTVREGSADDLPVFHEMYLQTSQRQGFPPAPESLFRAWWCTLHPHGYLRLFLAEFKGEVVAGFLATTFRETVTLKRLGWSGRYSEYGLNDVLCWQLFVWAKVHGYRFCDLDGFDPVAARTLLDGGELPDELKRTAGFFKLGFRGEVKLYPGSFDYIGNPLLRWGYDHVLPMLTDLPLFREALNRLRVS